MVAPAQSKYSFNERSELVPFIPLLPQKFSFTTTITLCMSCNGKRMTR